ncbi:MAG TPA: hypothetical protein VIB01_12245, partial [Steroidobacteraceae bacterium]
MLRNRTLVVACVMAVAAAGCASQPREAAVPASRCSPARPFAEGGERATLWVRHSAEFRVASEI